VPSIDAVLIAGPTASGKSRLALELAERLCGTVIDADSMQVYRELRVLTARPSAADMARVPHLLYGHVSAWEHYSVGRYRADAVAALAEVRAANRIPIFAGGTGLYFAALTEGLADIPAVPAAIRALARARLDAVGKEEFHAELAARDPDLNLRATDTQRMLRAYEVLEATGRSLASFQRDNAPPLLGGLRLAKIVLDIPRPLLRERIETRFKAMLEQGALEEADLLTGLDPALPAAKILGLRQLLAFRAGAMSEAEALSVAVTATRQFAKRQMTWFRHRMADWRWVDGIESNILAELLTSIK
jgi:tRNA dimethylallyltransferase